MSNIQFRKNTLNLYGGESQDKKFFIKAGENNTKISTGSENDLILCANKLSLDTSNGLIDDVADKLNKIDLMAMHTELKNFETAQALSSLDNIKTEKINELDIKIAELESIISTLTDHN